MEKGGLGCKRGDFVCCIEVLLCELCVVLFAKLFAGVHCGVGFFDGRADATGDTNTELGDFGNVGDELIEAKFGGVSEYLSFVGGDKANEFIATTRPFIITGPPEIPTMG